MLGADRPDSWMIMDKTLSLLVGFSRYNREGHFHKPTSKLRTD